VSQWTVVAVGGLCGDVVLLLLQLFLVFRVRVKKCTGAKSKGRQERGEGRSKLQCTVSISKKRSDDLPEPRRVLGRGTGLVLIVAERSP
jgi:hypothetical protein